MFSKSKSKITRRFYYEEYVYGQKDSGKWTMYGNWITDLMIEDVFYLVLLQQLRH